MDTGDPVPAPTVLPPQPPLASRLRARLPEIVLEAASVVLAVLLALAVDEWREARSKRELAARAQLSILAELRANRDELRGTHAANATQLQRLQQTLDRLAAAPDRQDAEVELAFHVAELSDAAWETTRTTQAAQLMPFEWLVEIARVYERQSLFQTTQLDMLQRTRGAVAEFATGRRPAEIVAPIRSQLQTFQMLGEQLEAGYDRALASAEQQRKDAN